MSLVAAERRFGCDFCELKFKDATALKRHRNVKHTQEETHVCDHCAAVFYSKYRLDTHQAAKHGINDKFRCGKCKHFYVSEWTLLKHERKCSTNPCPVCGKEFFSKWKLGNHVKGHMDTKSHICDECGKDFLHNFTLVEHIEVVHQGKRPYTCTKCQKTFSRAGNLRAHKLIHTGVKPFPCKLCDKECREKIQLIKHLKKKHSIEDDQLQFYVKLVPKKEIVKDEGMKNILMHLTSVKTEPISAEPFDLKTMTLKTEPNDQDNGQLLGTKIEESELKPADVIKMQENVSITDRELISDNVRTPQAERKGEKIKDIDLQYVSEFIEGMEETTDLVGKELTEKAERKIEKNEDLDLQDESEFIKDMEETMDPAGKKLTEKVLESEANLNLKVEKDLDVQDSLDGFEFEKIEF